MSTNLSLQDAISTFFRNVEESLQSLLESDQFTEAQVTLNKQSLDMVYGDDAAHLVLTTDDGLKLVLFIEKSGVLTSRRTISLEENSGGVADRILAALL